MYVIGVIEVWRQSLGVEKRERRPILCWIIAATLLSIGLASDVLM